MIYRIGKYTPYKGKDQEIEMMLKFINNEDQDITICFHQIESPEKLEEEKKSEETQMTDVTEKGSLKIGPAPKNQKDNIKIA